MVRRPGIQRLLHNLIADRESLLVSIQGLEPEDLQLPTRNPGWEVKHALAHILTADMILISLLEEADDPATESRPDDYGLREREMSRWLAESGETIVRELQQHGSRSQHLLANLSAGSFARKVYQGNTPTTLGSRLRAWEGHDAEHLEDITLALKARSRPLDSTAL